MNITIPSAQVVREALQSLTMRQIDELAALSGVPATTIYKIKRGETDNPGIETVGKFLPHIAQVLTPLAEQNQAHPSAAEAG